LELDDFSALRIDSADELDSLSDVSARAGFGALTLGAIVIESSAQLTIKSC
jgi:hypothetical protein